MKSLKSLSLRNSPRHWRAVRAFTALTLMLVVFAAKSVQAEPVRYNQVVQTLSSYQGPADLRLGTITAQDPGNSKSAGTTNEPGNDGLFNGSVIAPDGSVLPLLQDPQNLSVEVIEEAEVEGTICDCGDFFIPGGFPKWPLLFLTAVPLVFINECDDCDENPISSPTPTPPPPPPPTPTPTPVPEPASLLLFGTSLLAAGAGLRRRYTRARAVEQAKSTTGEEQES